MQILTIAGYKFISLSELAKLRNQLQECCRHHELKGTILLSHEGININVAGDISGINYFKSALKTDARFADLSFRQSYSEMQPFQRLKVKIKPEIITLRQQTANPLTHKAQSVAPEMLKQWLDENRDITLLDVRNDYEISFGSFSGSVNLQLKNFSDFPQAVQHLERTKTFVMFCTGGIRCEKAALYMLSQGFTKVYQLEGGILNYFAQTNGAHYTGDCFVFDERISVTVDLQNGKSSQCRKCQAPLSKTANALCATCNTLN